MRLTMRRLNKRRPELAVVLGSVSLLAWQMAWSGSPGVILLPLTTLFLCIQDNNPSKATSYLWWAIPIIGLGTYLPLTWLIDAKGLFAGLGVVIYATEWLLTWGVFVFLVKQLRVVGKQRAWLLILMWLSFEMFQSHAEVGFPWLNLGNLFRDHPRWIQWYAWTGTLGGTVWVLGSSFALSRLVLAPFSKAMNLGIFILLTVGPWVGSHYLYNHASQVTKPGPGHLYEIGAIQTSSRGPFAGQETLNQLIDSLYHDVSNLPDVIVLPEGSIERFMRTGSFEWNSLYTKLSGLVARDSNLVVVSGCNVRHVVKSSDGIHSNGNYTSHKLNAACLIEKSGAARFLAKNKFVPFHEKVPEAFRFIDYPSAHYDYWQTATTSFVPHDSVELVPVICFESLFGEHCVQMLSPNPGFYLFLSSEGDLITPASKQYYLSLARLRAIEGRRYVVRSTNLGYNAFIDPRGEVIFKSDEYEQTALYTAKVSASSGLTFYSRHGDWIGRVALGALLLFLWMKFTQERLGAGSRSWWRYWSDDCPTPPNSKCAQP